ncbi:MAG: diacylglycerol kinase family protein [Candidatus Merdivicinus sp.]|jgi:diacylglycerol kinase (ATP)
MKNDIEKQTRALIKSFLYAFHGIRFCIKNERNMRIHLAAAIIVTAFSLVYHLEPMEYAVLFLAMGAVISLEAVNTALEALVNLTSPAYHNLARIAKDVAAGAVLVAACAAVTVGICLFGKWKHLVLTVMLILQTPLLAAGFLLLILAGIWFIFCGNRLFRD